MKYRWSNILAPGSLTPVTLIATSVVVISATLPARAAAQDVPAPAQDAAPSTASAPATSPVPGADIVVTGSRNTTITELDRKSYSLSNDIQAVTGSAADVLRNIPSVTVDIDGNPSLRGDSSVQILIDGRPAPQFNGANRGAVLQQLGADTIARIEVLTIPPANMKPDGSAGVINIITKNRRAAGRTASAQASVGSSGRFNLSGNASGRVGRVGLHGGITVRRDLRNRSTTDDKLITDPTTGAFRSASRLQSDSGFDRLSETATLGGDIDLGKANHLSAEGSYTHRFERSSYAERDVVFDQAGALIGQFGIDRPGTQRQTSSMAQLKFQHDLSKDGSNITILAQRSQTIEDQQQRYANLFTQPMSPTTFNDQNLYFDEVTRELSIDYTQMLPSQAKLILGYNLQRDDNAFDNRQTLAVPVGGLALPDPNFTNMFRHGQTVQAWYGSYERPLGDFTLLAGVRLEQTNVQTNQITSGQRGQQSYFRAYPSIHLSNKLTSHQTISFGMGTRVIRPESDDLNPYPVRTDAFTLRSGNPALRPQEIRSYELGWAYEKGAVSRSATLYYRDITNAFTPILVPIDATTVLVTQGNIGRTQRGGLELVAAGKLIPALGYTLSGNILYNRIDTNNLGLPGKRTVFSWDAKAALNWSITAKDSAQLNLQGLGKRLTAQGYRKPYMSLDIGYRRQLRPDLALTLTVSDLLASRREGQVYNTLGLSEVIDRRPTSRIALIGLSWTLPGAKKKAEKFDYAQ